MDHKTIAVVSKYRVALWGILITTVVLFQVLVTMAVSTHAVTMKEVYPGLATGVLKSARPVSQLLETLMAKKC